MAAAVWLVAGSCLSFGQAEPPPAVDQELRSRVTEFLQGFVDRQFRKLLPLVAEDTQEEFFGMGKTEMKSFQVGKIDYSNDFTKAAVHSIVVKIWRAEGYEFQPQVPLETTWKIENGKWVWYHELKNDELITPMAPSDISKIMDNAKGGTMPQLPKMSQSVLDATALGLAQQSSLDKSDVTLATDKASTDVVTVKNGARGTVDLSLVGLPDIEGFTATLDKPRVDANESAQLRIEYNPPADATGSPAAMNFAVLVSPFNQQLVVHVSFVQKPK
jgi:hypothetical protein